MKTRVALALLFALLVALCAWGQTFQRSLPFLAKSSVVSTPLSDTNNPQYLAIALSQGYDWSDDGTNWYAVNLTNAAYLAYRGSYISNASLASYFISPYSATARAVLKSINRSNYITGATLSASDGWTAAEYGNSVYLIGGYAALKYGVSADGLTYSENSIGGLGIKFTKPVFAQGKFLLTGRANSSTATGQDKYGLSTDGTNWSVQSFPSAMTCDTALYGTNWLIVPSYTNANSTYPSSQLVFASADATNWGTVTLPIRAYWTDAAWGNGIYLAVAYRAYAGGAMINNYITSPDGTNWATQTFPVATNWIAVTYGGGKFIALIQDSNRAAISADGTNWANIALASSLTWVDIAAKP